MEAEFPVNHNYYEECPLSEDQLARVFGAKKNEIKNKLFSSYFELTTQDIDVKNIQIVHFNPRRYELSDGPELILKLYAKERNGVRNYYVQTGLYAGVIFHKGCRFNITVKYGTVFLHRMLNFLNNIFIDRNPTPAVEDKKLNTFQLILGYLFLNSLEKAAILGLPHEYVEVKERTQKFRGSVDLNEYLRRDIPFSGKLSVKYREQKVVQSIADVLYSALGLIEVQFGNNINRNLLGVKHLLRQSRSNLYVGSRRVLEAKEHKVLDNPMFSPFKQVLKYAELIINCFDLSSREEARDLQTTGYLFDISELFEVYLEKLLRLNFQDWLIEAQSELIVYPNAFFRRAMYPDIILRCKKSGQYAVFDAKFKTMRMLGIDLDRADFYQIHSYILYHSAKILIGGLIYPIVGKLDLATAHTQTLLGVDKEGRFVIDGIELSDDITLEELLASEISFINRTRSLLT